MGDSTRRFYARRMFELRVHKAAGTAYEELFRQVMQRRYPDFVPMRPYGKLGDRKNDGYIKSQGLFFQVYAPLEPKVQLAAAVRKAEQDFAGLKKNWESTHPINGYRFVFNDKFLGSVEPIEKALAAIEKAHGIEARVFLAKDLESEFFQLTLEEMQDVLGAIIPEPGLIEDAKYDAVRDVVEYVLNMSALPIPPEKLIAPELDAKIRFNGLTAPVADLLRSAAYQVDVVDDYFSTRGGNPRQELRDHLAAIYSNQRDTTQAENGSPDELFFGLLDTLTPPTDRMKAAVKTAALVILAYYFEACDIFEVPDASP